MTDTELVVFEILQRSLFIKENGDDLFFDSYDWNAVFTEMKNQAVAALPLYLVRSAGFQNLDVQRPWEEYIIRSQGHWLCIMHEQSSLLNLLEANNIPSVILKGSAAAITYPHPSLRMMGDIDIFVKRCDHSLAAKLLEENGYSLVQDKKACSSHFSYSKSGIAIELHRKIPIVEDTDEYRLKSFEEGIDHRIWLEIDSFKFPVFPPVLNGMVLLFHINQHLREGLGLRQIIDWGMYIKNLPPLQWPKLLDFIRSVHMETLAITVTAMCEKYLGIIPEFEYGTYDDALVVDLMEYIISKGNFGQKGGKEEKTSAVFLDMANPIRILKRLEKGGLYRWKATKRYALLRPFAWIYQIGYILYKLTCNQMTLQNMIRAHKTSLKQRGLIKRLGLKLDRMISD